LKLSVSTKIFLGFAVVIIAFGAASTYSIHRLNAHRESVAIIWQEVNPMSLDLRGMLRKVQAQDEYLGGGKRNRDIEYLQRALPKLKVIEQFINIEERIESIVSSGKINEYDRQNLVEVQRKIALFREGDELFRAINGREMELSSQRSSELYDFLITKVVTLANQGKLHSSSPESIVLRRALRKISHVIINLRQMLDTQVQNLDERAAEDEKVATLAVILIASAALIISLLMLFISQWTLAPIRWLSEGVRRVAAGHYDEEVRVRATDEIGQLAQEFNRMATSLRERDSQLEKQREILLRADRLATIGKFAAQITHEVRNPLSSIGLNAELIEEELDLSNAGPEVSQIVRAIQEEVERLKLITEGYLQYARLPQPDVSDVALGPLISELMSFLASEISQAGIEWESQNLDGGFVAIVDGAQLRQALMNIIRNAIDALQTGSVSERRLSIMLSAPQYGKVAIEITDTGDGIQADMLDRIFEPFVTGKAQGTGLGLALSHEIVAGHQGSIRVLSPVYKGSQGPYGTTFRIELPGQKMIGAVVDGA
jgi:two-component system NtrC family sensor kinase